ncbi:hypothetical protein ACH5RR_000016, partial [Cinchona calisaya]
VLAKRGPTRNIKLANRRRKSSPLSICIDEVSGRVVGDDAQHFISESGCIVRKLVSSSNPTWSKLSSELKDDIYNNCTQQYEVGNSSEVKTRIHQQLASQMKSFKHRLHKRFQKYPSKEEAMKHVPEGFDKEAWIKLCEEFDSKAFKCKKSEKPCRMSNSNYCWDNVNCKDNR